ncbi:MAG: chorismate synthase [Chloroflexi bacterium]|nr:chorismate synthase [Chloroflexota bacterium]
MFRFLTAGESHGPALTVIVEGLPAGLALDIEAMNDDLRRRQGGYGRGGRQQIEQDRIQFLGGVYEGKTIGAPVVILIPNRDYENWRERVVPPWTKPRPGHADLAGGHKYGLGDLRLVAERASARETAARVAAGALAKNLLRAVDIAIGSYVESIGGVMARVDDMPLVDRVAAARASDIYCPDELAAADMRARIDEARQVGDSLGGTFVVVALNVPVGLGSHVQWDRRLDGRLAQAVMSIQAVKGVEIGPAFANAALRGTQVHDAIYPGPAGPWRQTNRAGGLEGGMSNGEPIVVRAAMKPIPTTITPIPTVDLATGEAAQTEYSRSDVCAVPAASIVGEAMVALTLAEALLERFGGDDIDSLVRRVADDRFSS